MKIESNSRQVPSSKSYTAEKKYSDLLYGVLQEMSEMEEENSQKIRYISYKDISYSKLADKVNLTRQTVSTKFKHLISVGLIIDDKEKERYILRTLDREVSSLIPFETLRTLNNSLSHNSISTFVYLLKRYYAEGQHKFIVTLRQIKEFIGISTNTTSNDVVVTDILHILNLVGLIEYTKVFTEETKSMYQITAISNKVKGC
jgi:DNA-binding Lrp family transcriptional regulator